VSTLPVATFIDRDGWALLPGIQCFVAIGTKIFGWVLETFMKLEQVMTYFAFKLSALIAIIVVNIFSRRVATRTAG